MSSRTAGASRAIREAWENEKRLVLEGKGSRDWTEEQQKQIIEKGKAYDWEGRAFEGQHMKCVSMYPEYQDDASNIQLLSREEHFAAHNGNWKNPTNGYYDPVAKTMSNFGDGPPQRCAEMPLTNPHLTDHLNATSTSPRGEARHWTQSIWRISVKALKNPHTWKAAATVVAALIAVAPNRSPSGNGDSTDAPSAESTTTTGPGPEGDISHTARKSPDEHDVNGYARKDGTTVQPYRRGGKKE